MNPSNREREIFDAAMDLPSPEERAVFLRQACGEDAALWERVNALLKASESGAGFLPDRPDQAPWNPADAPLAEGPGTVLHHYKLLEQIGEGGFGVVYMAEQLEPVRRRVALKIIKPGMDSKHVIGRFEAERQALAMMEHPNIAQIYDAGTMGGNAGVTGRPYFVMELVNGIPITRFCEEQQLDLSARLNLLVEVCGAVQHAHQKGIIHRDLKPSNILVTLHGEKPVPKVIDFGIAKATEQPLTDKTVFTHFQQFMGTPAYMSPEQTALSGLDVDTRSDIYSLGVLLYELLTGGPPFAAKELLSAGLDEMRRIIRETEPERPSARLRKTTGITRAPAGPQPAPPPVRSGTRNHANRAEHAPASDGGVERRTQGRVRSPIPSDLDWIVMKALEKDRARRYETANGLARDLQRYLACEPVVARPPSAFYRLQKFTRRHRPLVLSASVIGVLLAAATVVSSSLAFRLNRSNREVTRESEANAAMLGFFTHDLMGQEGTPRNRLQDLKLGEAVTRAAASLDTRFPDRPDIERRIRIQLGDILRSLGQTREAREEYRKALAFPAVGGAGLASKDRVVLLRAIAECSFGLQDYDEAVRCLREARALAGSSITPGSKLEMRLQLFEQIVGRWTDPEGLPGSLQGILDSADNSAHDVGIQGEYLPLIAQLYTELGQYEAALQVLTPLLQNADGSLKAVNHGNLNLFAPLAEVLCALKDPDRALRLINAVMEVHEAEPTNAASPPAEFLRIKGMILGEAGGLEAGEHPPGRPDLRRRSNPPAPVHPQRGGRIRFRAGPGHCSGRIALPRGPLRHRGRREARKRGAAPP